MKQFLSLTVLSLMILAGSAMGQDTYTIYEINTEEVVPENTVAFTADWVSAGVSGFQRIFLESSGDSQ